MILYPAIDILQGQAVRLVQGRFEDSTVYHDDPLEAARSWVDAGARILHVVDLDGAKAGEPRSLEHLRRIVAGTGVPVQYGGGLRTVDAVRDALRTGAERAVVGTAAFRTSTSSTRSSPPSARASSSPSTSAPGTSPPRAGPRPPGCPRSPPCDRLGRRGVASFVYTSVERDGGLVGPDLDEVRRVAEAVRGRFLYSGGIGDLDHLRGLAHLRQVNLAGVIVGKALYERRFTVAEGQAALDAAAREH